MHALFQCNYKSLLKLIAVPAAAIIVKHKKINFFNSMETVTSLCLLGLEDKRLISEQIVLLDHCLSLLGIEACPVSAQHVM